ncbi:U-box domain-containing protein 35-like isoform X2 [Cucumis melo]|uniref:RING-type E3 ubiquitin transferase n=1 Tax=Cucumis melo TaxID=3656 RepID=A0ABM3KRY2_CUCME|nr:U-box domain-containing protein 35-like isoform X2 [Cucumis melo]
MAKGGAQKKDVAVAIDKDKCSQYALKWTIERLLSRGQVVTLLHVKQKPSSSAHSITNLSGDSDMEEAALNKQHIENHAKDQFFLPFRCICTRSNIPCNEVMLEEGEIPKALINHVSKNVIDILVLGAPTRSIYKRFKSDIPSMVSKGAPDFCTVYIIANKGKVTVKQSTAPAPAKPVASPRTQIQPPPPRPQLLHQLTNASEVSSSETNQSCSQSGLETQISIKKVPLPSFQEDWDIKSPFTRPGSRASMSKVMDPLMVDSDISFVSSGRRSTDYCLSGAWNSNIATGGDSFRLSNASEFEVFSPGPTSPLMLEMGEGTNKSVDSNTNDNYNDNTHSSFPQDMSFCSSPSETFSWPSHSQTQDDVEAEMRRLKLELKQTMDMYSTACKEAITAKQKAMELHRWKVEEEQRLEAARMAEEAALAMAEKEKIKCKAAMEAAEAAQRNAALEAKKRARVEKMVDMEAQEMKRTLSFSGYGQAEIGYRKYTIQEIETATKGFSDSLKIGEGGYGPVFRGELDHTPVAIKVLRPDAAHGRSQFQQEVEVLSCIRHPNMVLLLGACPEKGCLVYEFMANGSLEDCLFRKANDPILSWQLRFRIAAEIATGLLFLHQTRPEPIVHRDLKPGNILLDSNYVSKISDVGLARLVPPSVADSVTQYRMTATAGTFFYIDPEYQQTGLLGIKSDIYSLGVMLLQIITARPPIGLAHAVERAIEKGKFAEILDPEVKDWPVEDALKFAKLSIKCAEMRKRDRPDLGKVVLPELNRLRTMAEESMGIIGSFCCSSTCSSPYASQTSQAGAWVETSSSQSDSSTSSYTREKPYWVD